MPNEASLAAGDTGMPPVRRLRVVASDTYPDWESIYRDNVEWVYRLLFAKVGNRQDAEDLTTEVFLTALRPLRVSATVPEVRAYILATARTTLAGHWRRTLGTPVTALTDKDVEQVLARRPASASGRPRAASTARRAPASPSPEPAASG